MSISLHWTNLIKGYGQEEVLAKNKDRHSTVHVEKKHHLARKKMNEFRQLTRLAKIEFRQETHKSTTENYPRNRIQRSAGSKIPTTSACSWIRIKTLRLVLAWLRRVWAQSIMSSTLAPDQICCEKTLSSQAGCCRYDPTTPHNYKTATSQKVAVAGSIMLRIRIEESCILIMIGIVRNPTVFVLLCTSFIVKFI